MNFDWRDFLIIRENTSEEKELLNLTNLTQDLNIQIDALINIVGLPESIISTMHTKDRKIKIAMFSLNNYINESLQSTTLYREILNEPGGLFRYFQMLPKERSVDVDKNTFKYSNNHNLIGDA